MKFYNNKLHNLLFSPVCDDESKKGETGGACEDKRDEKCKVAAT